jgi:plasmid stability protein
MPNFLIRDIPEGVYKLLKGAAEQNQRSLNKEIIARLEASLFTRRLPPEEFLRRMDELRSHQKGLMTIEEIDAAKRFGRE